MEKVSAGDENGRIQEAAMSPPIKKDSDGAVYCKCGHPVWAHVHRGEYTSESGTDWPAEPEECNWDIEGPRCICKQFKGDFEEVRSAENESSPLVERWDQVAFDWGSNARKHGVALYNCPFLDNHQHEVKSWRAGWTDQDRVLRNTDA